MIIKFNRSNCNIRNAGYAERISNSLFNPAALAFGRKIIIINDHYEKVSETNKAGNIGYKILFCLFIPITGTLSLAALGLQKFSSSYKTARFCAYNPSREKIDPNLRKWPKDLKAIGLTQKDKETIEDILKTVIPYVMQGNAPPLIPPKGEIFKFQAKSWVMPKSINLFFWDGNLTDIILFLNKDKMGVVSQSGNRIPKYAYNLTTGKLMVKKPLKRSCERELSLAFVGKKGLVGSQLFRQTTKKSEIKEQIIEELYEGDLKGLLKKDKRLSPAMKIQMCHSLLQGLATFHNQTSFFVDNTSNKTTDFKAFHYDIKPSNVFMKGNEPYLGDYDCANYLEKIAGTRSFMAPEVAEKFISKTEILTFNITYGQKTDLWSMGLTLGCILKGKLSWEGSERPPFDFINSHIKVVNNKTDNSDLLNITQSEIDKELESIQHFLKKSDKALLPLWKIVHSMLRVKPEERMEAQTALNIIAFIKQ